MKKSPPVSIPNSPSEAVPILRVALRDTLGEAVSAVGAVAGLASLSNHAREEMAVRDYIELLGYSVDELGWSLDAMAEPLDGVDPEMKTAHGAVPGSGRSGAHTEDDLHAWLAGQPGHGKNDTTASKRSSSAPGAGAAARVARRAGGVEVVAALCEGDQGAPLAELSSSEIERGHAPDAEEARDLAASKTSSSTSVPGGGGQVRGCLAGALRRRPSTPLPNSSPASLSLSLQLCCSAWLLPLHRVPRALPAPARALAAVASRTATCGGTASSGWARWWSTTACPSWPPTRGWGCPTGSTSASMASVPTSWYLSSATTSVVRKSSSCSRKAPCARAMAREGGAPVVPAARLRRSGGLAWAALRRRRGEPCEQTAARGGPAGASRGDAPRRGQARAGNSRGGTLWAWPRERD
uniref:Uncharacterized protein n=1 Tax=Aegilops tauschii subsp. strangulata TaxID=200361 RepID=A0A453IUM2_AEGTS